MTAKLLQLEEIAGKVGLYAQAMLEMCGYEGVGHITVLVRNAEQGGSDQVTATNMPVETASQLLSFIAEELASGPEPIAEVTHD